MTLASEGGDDLVVCLDFLDDPLPIERDGGEGSGGSATVGILELLGDSGGDFEMASHRPSSAHIVGKVRSSFGHVSVGKLAVEFPAGNLFVFGEVSGPRKVGPYEAGIGGMDVARLAGV